MWKKQSKVKESNFTVEVHCWDCYEWTRISKNKTSCRYCLKDIINFKSKMVMGKTGYIDVKIEDLSNHIDTEYNYGIAIWFVRNEYNGSVRYYIVLKPK